MVVTEVISCSARVAFIVDGIFSCLIIDVEDRIFSIHQATIPSLQVNTQCVDLLAGDLQC